MGVSGWGVSKMGPLLGLKIIEMVGLGPCPLAGQLLADLGAEVTVIDRASGLDQSGEINRRGKRSIAINLKNPSGVSTLLKLIENADVLMEGFRPGVMEKLGLGPDICLEHNPKLIYGRMTGWGQEGPSAKTAGHDINYLGITGALNAMGEVGEPPRPPLNLVADYGGGSMFLIMGILSALYERNTSGKGQVIDAAMIDGVPAMMGMIQSMLEQGTWTNNRQNNFLDGAAPYYRCYRTKDFKFMSVGAIEPQFYAELLGKLGLPAELGETQNDKNTWATLSASFAKIFAAKTRDEWTAVFKGSDACVAPVLDFDEAPKHPQNAARDTFFKHNHLVQTSPAPRFSRTIPEPPAPAKTTGAENTEILRNNGFSEEEITALETDGVLL